MSFFIAKNQAPLESVMDADTLMRGAPEVYGPRLQAIKELRDIDDGTLHKGNAFRRVASFVNIPIFKAVSTILDPDFMRDKRKFYAWLDRNKQYCTYQRPSKAARAAQVQRDIGHLGKAVMAGEVHPSIETQLRDVIRPIAEEA